MAYIDIYRVAVEDGTAQQRMTVAIAFVAQDVLVESDATPHYAARIAWARAALAAPQTMARKMIWAVLADPAVDAAGAEVTDDQIKVAVASRVNDFVLA